MAHLDRRRVGRFNRLGGRVRVAGRSGGVDVAKLTQAELERHLWHAADILRGTVDAGDYKQYIFGLLFYKRLCDVWDEEFEALLAETGDRDEAGRQSSLTRAQRLLKASRAQA